MARGAAEPWDGRGDAQRCPGQERQPHGGAGAAAADRCAAAGPPGAGDGSLVQPRAGADGGRGMSALLNRLFGLSDLGFGAEGVELGFARPFPAWVWLLAILAAGGLAWWSYWKLDGARRWRIALAAGRALVLLAIL